MRPSFYLILLLYGMTLESKAQKQQTVLVMSGNLNCHYKAKYTAKQRRTFYPFSIADTVKLVSFRFNKNNIVVRKDSVLKDSLIEVKTLNSSQVEKLTDILYNNFYKQQPNYADRPLCQYTPRHAILFIGSDGKVKEFITLCFHCMEYRCSAKRVEMGDDCSQKMEKLYRFFFAEGIRFGTNRHIYEFPGEVTYIDRGTPVPFPKQ